MSNNRIVQYISNYNDLNLIINILPTDLDMAHTISPGERQVELVYVITAVKD